MGHGDDCENAEEHSLSPIGTIGGHFTELGASSCQIPSLVIISI